MTTVWSRYTEEQRTEYINFIKVYASLSNLFRQKHGDAVPYLDSKFQETVYARSFNSKNVDIGNTPHDIVSEFGDEKIGIGLKTWMNTSPSYQKVMQLKRYRSEIAPLISSSTQQDLAIKLSQLKNEKLEQDYERLGLSSDKNIYHYITRDKGKLVLFETSYPLVNIDGLCNLNLTETSFQWSDGIKDYKFTFGDSQIWEKFGEDSTDTHRLCEVEVEIVSDPFDFLIQSYNTSIASLNAEEINIVEAYLPLYSYTSKEVEEKSGLNAWNAKSKTKGSTKLRPLNEVYIPIPREFHKLFPSFFCEDIFKFEEQQDNYSGPRGDKPQIRFMLQLPNGKKIPALVTQSNMKGLQSGSRELKRPDGTFYGQSDLGQWLLVEVLGLKDRVPVTREWLKKKGTDSVRLWRNKGDYETFHIDFAPTDSFENFMKGLAVNLIEDPDDLDEQN
ncbi:NgoFVII family restriction endonuclease [Enterococcus mundtii]|uniref:restriction endonuclease PLD domain-containing protein n=1 Tax=Enterococcus TaxID=1350 RepID=UPI00254286D6|nr:restriction endonuclease PLD domain-containing protein [Enterococcus mundtii]MDK4212304.1 NgoFVII family restriction endonuclease [Enterococcus mundtii]